MTPIISNLCQKAADILKSKYPNHQFGYEYDEDTQIHHIWYNDVTLKEQDDFASEIDTLLNDLFFSQGIYNVFVSYFFKYDKSNRAAYLEDKDFIKVVADSYTKSHLFDECKIKIAGADSEQAIPLRFYNAKSIYN